MEMDHINNRRVRFIISHQGETCRNFACGTYHIVVCGHYHGNVLIVNTFVVSYVPISSKVVT